jgi:hypothetical protein
MMKDDDGRVLSMVFPTVMFSTNITHASRQGLLCELNIVIKPVAVALLSMVLNL